MTHVGREYMVRVCVHECVRVCVCVCSVYHDATRCCLLSHASAIWCVDKKQASDCPCVFARALSCSHNTDAVDVHGDPFYVHDVNFTTGGRG